MTIKHVFILISGFFLFVAVNVIGHGNGAETIILEGGKNGRVPFPHHQHHETLNDCQKCHGLFPQESGIIEKMKDEGQLKSKQVMKQCLDCHRKLAKAGEKSGPRSCKKCHIKG